MSGRYRKITLPILSNILIETDNSKLIITATDLDLITIHQIENIEVLEEEKQQLCPQLCMTL